MRTRRPSRRAWLALIVLFHFRTVASAHPFDIRKRFNGLLRPCDEHLSLPKRRNHTPRPDLTNPDSICTPSKIIISCIPPPPFTSPMLLPLVHDTRDFYPPPESSSCRPHQCPPLAPAPNRPGRTFPLDNKTSALAILLPTSPTPKKKEEKLETHLQRKVALTAHADGPYDRFGGGSGVGGKETRVTEVTALFSWGRKNVSARVTKGCRASRRS